MRTSISGDHRDSRPAQVVIRELSVTHVHQVESCSLLW